MIPDSLQTCKPIYRKLNPRTPEELALVRALEAKKNKKRKSKSANTSQYKDDTVKVNKKNKKGKKTEQDQLSCLADE